MLQALPPTANSIGLEQRASAPQEGRVSRPPTMTSQKVSPMMETWSEWEEEEEEEEEEG